MKRFIQCVFTTAILSVLAMATSLSADESGFEGINFKFELSNEADELITEQDVQGSYVLLAFGFTHCAHICPMMAANMALALNASERDSQGIFISVDTERDTPQITHAYASKFHESMMGLSGSHEQVQQAALNFGVSFVVTKSQKAYTVEHTSDIFLIGPDGKVIEVFALNASPKAMANAINMTTE